MMKFAYVTAVLGFIATPALAQAPSVTADKTKNAGERLICQKEENIGSRLAAKRVCLTAKEWKERAAANREETERVQMGTQMQRSN